MKLTTKIPQDVYLAFSGGIDSTFALHFLLRGRKNVTCLHFNHGTPQANLYEQFCRRTCDLLKVRIITGKVNAVGSGESFWHRQRYSFFSNYSPIITAHHFDDYFESRLMGRKIAVERDQFIRPFLLWNKEEIVSRANQWNLTWCEDTTNAQNFCTRNKLRNLVIPTLKECGTPLLNNYRREIENELQATNDMERF